MATDPNKLDSTFSDKSTNEAWTRVQKLSSLLHREKRLFHGLLTSFLLVVAGVPLERNSARMVPATTALTASVALASV